MRFLLKLKFFALVAIWTLICLALYVVLALIEGAAEIGLGAAGAAVGQGTAVVNAVDLGGDIVQWVLGFIWLIGIAALWYAKRLVTSREARAQAGRMAMGAATTAAPYIIRKHPLGRAYDVARGPAGRMIGGYLAKKLKR